MATPPAEEKKMISFADLQAHNNKDDLYVLIHGKVYNATKFLDEHPGGDEVILAEAGKDATEAFEDVGHSDEAREVLNGLYVGDYEGGKPTPLPPAPDLPHDPVPRPEANMFAYLVPVAFVGAFLAWRFYFAP